LEEMILEKILGEKILREMRQLLSLRLREFEWE
jgi:hypothetical protein